MSSEAFYNLVVRYLSKESSEKEAEQLQLLLKEQTYQEQFNSICKGWVMVKDPAVFSSFDVNTGLRKLEQKLAVNQKRKFGRVLSNLVTLPKISKKTFNRVSLTLSILILIAFSSHLLRNVFTKDQSQTWWINKRTVNGEKLVIEMIDGTSIILNADSQIKYPNHFGANSREIYLMGEAYFQVAHNKSKPFIVHSDDLTTTVLGTVFNVCAFEKEDEIKVSLINGAVKVSSAEFFNSRGSVMLKPSQQFVFNKRNFTSTVGLFDLQKEVGWKDNFLKFDNEPLENVFAHLRRTFGVEFEVSKKSLMSKKITTNFRNESLWTVAEVIKKLTGLQYKTIKINNQLKKIIYY